jgi:hypothetical protein
MIDLEEISLRAPRYPEETPYWPCVLFLFREEEIVAALFYDDTFDDVGYPVDEHGVIDLDAHVDADQHAVGWSLQILAESEPSPIDPRQRAPSIDVLGEDLSVPEALEHAAAEIQTRASARAQLRAVARLVWRPVHGWPAQ